MTTLIHEFQEDFLREHNVSEKDKEQIQILLRRISASRKFLSIRHLKIKAGNYYDLQDDNNF